MAQRKDPEQVLSDLFRKFRISGPPVPVDAIARGLGILLCPLPDPGDISGAIVRRGNKTVIAINPSQHSNRQRFTIAHELGHFLLHESHEMEFVDRDFTVAWRNSDSAKAIDWREVEANGFAARMLMPTKFLRNDLEKLKRLDDNVVDELARRYAVSSTAMRIRLTNLGLIPGERTLNYPAESQ